MGSNFINLAYIFISGLFFWREGKVRFMDFWEDLKLRLKKANFNQHDKGLQESGMGSQIFMPDFDNAGTQTSELAHSHIPEMAQKFGLTGHHVAKATGGWVADAGRVGNLPAHERLQTEPISVHRLYGNNAAAHSQLRDNLLPHIQQSLSQDATLGLTDSVNGEGHVGNIKPFRFNSLKARLPVDLDVNDKNNVEYRKMMGSLGELNGGFTHYQMPGENQIQMLGHPKDLDTSQGIISDYLKNHHGANGNFERSKTKGFLYVPHSQGTKTAGFNASSGTMGPVRNAIHTLKKMSKDDILSQHYLFQLGIDNTD
jgi:hypothetical protein